MTRIPGFPNGSGMNSILPGKCLRLREGLFRQLREREWIFNRMEDNLLFLVHKSGSYGVIVGTEAIDWNET